MGIDTDSKEAFNIEFPRVAAHGLQFRSTATFEPSEI